MTMGSSGAPSSMQRREFRSSFRLSAAADGDEGAFLLPVSTDVSFILRWASVQSSFLYVLLRTLVSETKRRSEKRLDLRR